MNITNEFQDFRFNYHHIDNPQRKDYSRHMHYECEILLFEEGEVSYVIEDKRYYLKSHDLLLIPSARYHFAEILPQESYGRYMIDFSPDSVVPELVREIFCHTHSFHLEADSPIIGAFQILRSLTSRRDERYNELICRTLLTEILFHTLHLQEDNGAPENTVSESDCSQIVAYVNRHLTEIENLDEIANRFYTSKSSLSHNFKRTMGISLMKYIHNKRLLLAQERIRAGGKPTEVYALCGYKDYATFFRAYTKYFGKNPSDEA